MVYAFKGTAAPASENTQAQANKARELEPEDERLRAVHSVNICWFITKTPEKVKMKMFGSLTRETREWHPHRLLCKRLNIPDPYPQVT